MISKDKEKKKKVKEKGKKVTRTGIKLSSPSTFPYSRSSGKLNFLKKLFPPGLGGGKTSQCLSKLTSGNLIYLLCVPFSSPTSSNWLLKLAVNPLKRNQKESQSVIASVWALTGTTLPGFNSRFINYAKFVGEVEREKKSNNFSMRVNFAL